MHLPNNHPVDATRNGGEDFVGDGAEDEGELGGGGVVTEDGDRIADLRIHARDVKHTHIHADVADRGHAVAVQGEGGGAAAEMAVNAVGIPDGNGGDGCAAGSDMTIAAVAAMSAASQSCQKSEIEQYTNAIVTVIPPQSGSTISIMLDENTVAYPVNYSGNDLGATEQRALITFREPKGAEGRNYSSAGPQIFIAAFKPILTKPLAENLGEEQNAESYGPST